MQLAMGFAERAWWVVKRTDIRARLLADRHYSRQTPGADEFLSSGKTLVMVTPCGRAVWGIIENRVPNGPELRWRCAIFRNEGAGLSSELIASEGEELNALEWAIAQLAESPEAVALRESLSDRPKRRDMGTDE